MSEFRFKCQLDCGKCCVSAPDMPLLEGWSYYQDFILGMKTHVIPVPSQNSGLYSQCGPTIFDKTTGKTYIGWISVEPLKRASDNHCPALSEDKSCSIYSSRPSPCKAMPYSALLPDQEMGLAFMEKTIGCPGMGEDAPIVWQGGKNIDIALEIELEKAKGFWKDSYRISQTLLQILIEETGVGISQINAVELIPFNLFYLDAAPVTMLEKMPEKEVFLTYQIHLLKAFIDENMRRKKSEDRKSTETARRFLKIYQTME